MSIEEDVIEQTQNTKKVNISKKLLVIIVCFLAIVAFGVAMIYSKMQASSSEDLYSIFDTDKNNSEEPKLVLYNLPEIKTTLNSNSENEAFVLHIRITLGFKDVNNIKDFEALMPKLIDTVIATAIESTPQEISGAKGMYWFKEEILHRANLIMAPLEISSISFKGFEIERIITSPSAQEDEE